MHEVGGLINNGGQIKPKSPQRTFVDVIRRNGKRRGYITIRRRDDYRLEVGYSLCELGDRFSGALGLDIALKRGVRLMNKVAYVRDYTRGGETIPIIFVGGSNGDGCMVTLPPTILPRLLSDVEKAVGIFGEVYEPKWVEQLRDSSVLSLIHVKH